ncbi:MAG: glutathione S-transferase family protein [Thainema sp.]
MLKLYGGARSRASIVQWYLEEIQVPYEFVKLDLQAGEQRQPEFLSINPFGKVPAIVDGDLKLWESGAILLYLAEKYGGEADTVEQRAVLAQWVLFANATLGPGVFVESSREKEMPRLFAALNQHFASSQYVVGDQFGMADVAVGSYLAYIPMMLQIGYDDYPAIADYLQRMISRPAFKQTIGAR